MDDKLRLVAELQNKASAELRRLSKDMEGVKPSHGMAAARKWFDEFRGSADRTANVVKPISGYMGAIGIGGLAAGFSLGEMVKQFKELANQTLAMKEVGRQTGLTATEVKQLQAAASELNIDPTQMTQGLQVVAGHMYDFRRHVGELYGELNQFDPDFARKLSFDTPEQQIKDIVGWLGRIKDPQLQARWSEAFLGDAGLSRLAAIPGEFDRAWDRAAKTVAPVTAEMEAQAKLLNQSVVDFNTSWDSFKNDIGPTVFKELRLAADDFRATFESIKDAAKWLQAHKDHPVKDALKAGDDSFDQHAKDAGKRFRGEKPWGIGLPKPWTDDFGLTDPNKPWTPDDPYWMSMPDIWKGAKRGLNYINPIGGAHAEEAPSHPESILPRPPLSATNFDGNALRRNDEMPAPGPRPSSIILSPPVRYDPLSSIRVPASSQPENPSATDAIFTLGSLGTEVKHLNGTLKDWHPARANAGILPAAFHPGEVGGPRTGLDLLGTITSGTKAGTIAAWRELMQQEELNAAAGTGAPGDGGAPDLRYGRAGGRWRTTPGRHSGGGHAHGGGAAGTAKGPAGIDYNAKSATEQMGISRKEWDAYREGVTDIEGKRYDRMGGAGGRFAGRYQMGPSEINDTARRLGVPSPSNSQFLADPAMQERFFENYTMDHYRTLMRNVRFAAMNHREQLKVLGYAHNQGTGGPTRENGAWGYLDRGAVGHDAFGTSGTAYFQTIQRRLDQIGTDKVAAASPAAPIGDKARYEAEQRLAAHKAQAGDADLIQRYHEQHAQAAPKPAAKFADGGHVRGPGGPRSDSIFAMLSNREFVVNAAATERHLPLLEAINAGKMPAFADGGHVGRTRVLSWLDFFRRPDALGGMGLGNTKLGRSKAGGMVAMMQGESGPGLNPRINRWDVNGPSIGTAQWHDVAGRHGGRATGLKAFAATLGKDWRDLGAQQQWWKREARTTMRAAWKAVLAAPSGAASLRAGIDRFEVPADKPGEFRKRLPNLVRLQRQGLAQNEAIPSLSPDIERALRVASLGTSEVNHTGGARIDLHVVDGKVKSVRSAAKGLIASVNLVRGPTFASASETG